MVTRDLARDKRRILTSAATSSNRVRLRDAYRFFTPLLLMAELTMFSHAIVAAFLARMPNPTENLAAYSIAFFSLYDGQSIVGLPDGAFVVHARPAGCAPHASV